MSAYFSSTWGVTPMATPCRDGQWEKWKRPSRLWGFLSRRPMSACLSHRPGAGAGSCCGGADWVATATCWSTTAASVPASPSAPLTSASAPSGSMWAQALFARNSRTTSCSLSRPRLAHSIWWPRRRRRCRCGCIASVRSATSATWRTVQVRADLGGEAGSWGKVWPQVLWVLGEWGGQARALPAEHEEPLWFLQSCPVALPSSGHTGSESTTWVGTFCTTLIFPTLLFLVFLEISNIAVFKKKF